MNKKSASLLCIGVLLLVWVWRTTRTILPPSAPPAAPAVTVAKSQPRLPQPTTTNIAGIGLVPTDPRELEKFRAKAKREMQSALRTAGVFSNRDDMKQAQDNGELAWIYIEQRKNLQQAMDHIHGAVVEPYVPRTLAALEHILKHAEDGQLRLTAATLLYRYDQPAGKEYLLSVITSAPTDLRTRDAALVLALNREQVAIPGIVAAFPQMGTPPTTLLMAVGSWQDPSLTAMLAQQRLRNPQSWGLALALAQGADAEAVAMLGKTIAARRPLGYLQLTVEATLAKQNAFGSDDWQKGMREMFQKAPSTGVSTLLPAFAAAGNATGRLPLQQLLASTIPLHEAYVAGMESQAKGIRERIPELSNKFPKPTPSEFIMGAAQLLAQWDAKEAVPTLQQVLTTVQQGNRGNVYVNEALGLVLYKLDPANWRETLLNAGVPEYHVDRIPALAKLRPIPAEYLPKQVNLKAR